MAIDPEELDEEDREEDDLEDQQRAGRRRLLPENPIRWIKRRLELPIVSWLPLRFRRRGARR